MVTMQGTTLTSERGGGGANAMHLWKNVILEQKGSLGEVFSKEGQSLGEVSL